MKLSEAIQQSESIPITSKKLKLSEVMTMPSKNLSITPTKTTFGQRFGETLGRILPKKEMFQPSDIISGVAPYKIAQETYGGIKDVTLPKTMRTELGGFLTDIATAPETYVGGGIFGKQALRKTGESLRSFVGIPSKTVKWLKQRGAQRIFTSEKESVDYIKSILAPEAFKRYESGTTKVMEEEGKAMSKALSNVKDEFIKLPKTFNNIRRILKEYNLVDSKGQLTNLIKEREVPSAIKTLADMYKQTVEGLSYRGAKEVVMPKGFFQFYRKALRVAQRGAGEFKKDVQDVIEGLYDDIEKAGAKGINEARKLYKQAINLEDEFGLSQDSFASKLQSAVNPQNWKFIRERFRPILGKETDEIFNRIKDYLTAQEFVGRERVPFTKIGVGTRLGKKFLKSFYEKTQQGKGILPK